METVKGFIDHIIFRNAQNGYTVFSLIVDDDELTCVGILKTSEQGEMIEATGEYIEHPLYGKQFKIDAYSVVEPEDEVSIERYLASGAIQGIGVALAKRIVKRFGDSTFQIME